MWQTAQLFTRSRERSSWSLKGQVVFPEGNERKITKESSKYENQHFIGSQQENV